MTPHFCILVTSHANTAEKIELLKKCLISLRQLETPIILSSHISLPEEIQDLTYLTIKDSSNLILNEAQIMSQPVTLESPMYYINDSFFNILFSTGIFKKTYMAGTMNHYINSIRIVKSLGFENILFWEYDSILGINSCVRLKEFQYDYLLKRLEYYGFVSYIQGIRCLNAIPSLFNIDRVLEFLPEKPIENAKQYNELTRCKIIEQWMLDNLELRSRGDLIDLSSYNEYFSDTQRGLVGSQNGNYFNFDLRSGIFFNHLDKRSIFYALNTWEEPLTTQMVIKNPQDHSVVYTRTVDLNTGVCFFDYLGTQIDIDFTTSTGLDIEETVTQQSTGEENSFKYNISKNNLEFVSTLKKWKEL